MSIMKAILMGLWFGVVTTCAFWTLVTFVPMNTNPCGEGFITQSVAGHGLYCIKATKWEPRS